MRMTLYQWYGCWYTNLVGYVKGTAHRMIGYLSIYLVTPLIVSTILVKGISLTLWTNQAAQEVCYWLSRMGDMFYVHKKVFYPGCSESSLFFWVETWPWGCFVLFVLPLKRYHIVRRFFANLSIELNPDLRSPRVERPFHSGILGLDSPRIARQPL